MGLFDDIIKSAVKEALVEMAQQNNETEQTPPEQTPPEQTPPEQTPPEEPPAEDGKNVSRETFNMDDVSKMIQKEIRNASAQMLNRTPAAENESKTPDEAMRDILGLGEKGKNNGSK